MTGEEALVLAAAHGVRVTLALRDLRLEADDEPPAEVFDALREHKEAVVAELRKWRRIFERHVATIMGIRGLPRPEAERLAFDIVLIERLNATHPNIDRIAALAAAVPRRLALSYCRSGMALATAGCTRTAGSHGATADEQKRSPRWPRRGSRHDGEAQGRVGPYGASHRAGQGRAGQGQAGHRRVCPRSARRRPARAGAHRQMDS